MNSILYMVEYFIQCTDPNNINYNDDEFPMGTLLSKRPFMWVNIFWTIMPLYTILVYIIWMPPAYSQGQPRPNQRQYHTFNKNQRNESPPKYAYTALNSQQSINEVEDNLKIHRQICLKRHKIDNFFFYFIYVIFSLS